MNFFLDEYLDYLQESSAMQPAKFLIVVGFLYAIFKKWQQRQEIINGFCKKYKGDPLRLDICIAEKQIKNAKEIIRDLSRSKHTCDNTRSPKRCYEKVRYYVDKYKDKTHDLEKLIRKRKEKILKRKYKEKLRKIKQKYK